MPLILRLCAWPYAGHKIREQMCGAISDLIVCPPFQVLGAGEVLAWKDQGGDMRQGCTLPPLLSIAMFYDIQQAFLLTHPLAATPTVSLFDIGYADDTVLISRTREHMQALLHAVQNEASKYNLFLNPGKCKLVLYNTEGRVYFLDGSQVPQVSLVYLGALIDAQGKPAHEVSQRIGECQQVFKKLQRVWKHTSISISCKLHVYYSCVVNKLLYTINTFCGLQRSKISCWTHSMPVVFGLSQVPPLLGELWFWDGNGFPLIRFSDTLASCQTTCINNNLRCLGVSSLVHQITLLEFFALIGFYNRKP